MQTLIQSQINTKKVDPKKGSLVPFYSPRGKNLAQKFNPIGNWVEERNELGSWPFGKLKSQPGQSSINYDFSLFDYLGLSKHPEVIKAAENAIKEYGISSASSPSFNGRTALSQKLEEKTAKILQKETCLLYSSGWAACYGAVAAIATPRDTIIIDQLAHNCLSTAAKSATKDLQKFKHNNMDHLAELLKNSREKNKINSVIIVLESLYSMNSTTPDFRRVMELADQYEAIVIIDVAHELGVNGEKGLGVLETTDISVDNLIICGSFSKVFGTNGGFVVGPKCIRSHFMIFSPTYTYSSAMSPMAAAIILKSLEIAFSEEGDQLRRRVIELSNYLREQFTNRGFEIDGETSAIIPVVAGAEQFSREMFPKMINEGVLVNLIEFPVVQRGRSLFRFLLSPLHTFEELDRAVEIVSKARG
jgi:7-keto-8-aminopelargonate synthetase-like enzyme